MTIRPSEVVAKIPLTLADFLVLAGFSAVVTGLWLTFGVGPTLIAAGAIVTWVGGILYRAIPEKKD